MMGWRDGVFAAAFAGVSAAGFAAVCGCSCAAAQQRPATAVPCGGDEIARGGLSRVIDGRTFVLDDGREVRLAAIEVPPLESGAAPGGAAAAAAARNALTALLAGAQAVLRRAEFTSDRYGRIVAYAFALRTGVERSAQAELISAGFARVGDRVGSRDCAAELLRRENAARTAKLGLWANSYYDVLHADNPADVLARRGRFALVEGKVVSVHESGATIYVNFGRRWSEDFTVTIRKRNERSFAAAGLDLKRLTGRRVRVRGWIEERGSTGRSPWIEAARPEQIEPADLR
jgi:endonuclease YncB( thermonuclease family)